MCTHFKTANESYSVELNLYASKAFGVNQSFRIIHVENDERSEWSERSPREVNPLTDQKLHAISFIMCNSCKKLIVERTRIVQSGACKSMQKNAS